MKRRHPLLYRIFSVVLSFAVVLPATVALIGDSGSAQAATSLPYIEKLKQNKSTINVLEIVPQEGSGSIGYYIDGQEPCANWPKVAAGKTSQTDRLNYLNDATTGLFQKLRTAGLLGDDSTSTPLKSTGLYDEKYPWELHSGYTEMKLDKAETAQIQGIFTPVSNATGEFKQDSDYSLNPSGNGAYVQDIAYFVPAASIAPADVAKYYYYKPVFEDTANPPDPDQDNGTAVYINSSTYADPNGSTAKPDGYLYEGTIGDANFPGMEIGKKYYSVSVNTAPAVYSEAIGADPSYYAAIPTSKGFVAAEVGENGYFGASNTVYTYVGTGGDYTFSKNTNGGTYTLKYDTVYYSGGFTNNNWFQTNVCDLTSDSESKPTFSVKYVTPATINSRPSLINWANLVVLSNGFVPGGSITSPYSGTNDISQSVSDAIYSAVGNNLPIIVDNALITSASGTNIATLASRIKSDITSTYPEITAATTTFVRKGVFFFAVDGTRTALATNQFRTYYPDSSYTSSGSAYYPVYTEIQNENFLRKTVDPSAVLLPEYVNLARVVRYVINYAGKRVVEDKGTVNVLEIEPGSGSVLTADTVKGWLGYPAGSTALTVNIDTMSTAEFIGKIDSVSEKYDIVYVGSNLTNANSIHPGTTTFNDNSGLVYAGIGDTTTTYNSGDFNSIWKMSGMLKTDYSTTQTFSSGTYYKLNTSTNDARTFRYSGNDITQTKTQELQDFINSGFPVVLQDNLTTGSRRAATDAMTISATIAKNDSGGLTVTATGSDGKSVPSFYTPTYQWFYSSNNGISYTTTGTDSDSLSSTTAGYYYYCTISYTLSTGTYTATSNKVKAEYNYTYTATPSGKASSGKYSSTLNYTITLTGQSNTYNVSISPLASITSKWYGYWEDWFWGSGWDNLGSGTSIYNNDSDYSKYRCVVTLDGTKYTLELDKNATSTKTSTNTPATVSKSENFDITVAVTPGTTGATLTASTSPAFSGVTYQWHYSDDTIFSPDGAKKANLTSGSYYCVCPKISPVTTAAKSQTYTISSTLSSITYTDKAAGTPTQQVPSQPADNFKINEATVDKSSYIFQLMDENKSKLNLMQRSTLSVTENQDKLKKYVNLSKPEIDFLTSSDLPSDVSAYPTKYTGPGGLSLEAQGGTYYLEYYFSVKNDADPDPASTRYTCNLYIDANGDGRYSDNERLSDAVIRTWNSTDKTVGSVVSNTALKTDTEYFISRSMSADRYGVIPWKLEIVKTGSPGIHTSYHDYTHITTPSTKAIKIDVLQINASNGFNLQTDPTYQGLIRQVQDYSITITTLTQSDIMNPTIWQRTINGKTEPCSLFEYLKSYNMLIIGFKDSYDGITDTNLVAAVKSYITETGQAVLFTHDTVSYYNIPFSGYQTINGTKTGTINSTGVSSCYSLMMSIRDAVGLDRYGVTNSAYGGNKPYLVNRSGLTDPGLAATGYLGASSGALLDILNNNYSVAFEPKSGRVATTVPQTQGYSNGILLTKSSNDPGNYPHTNRVTQENEGQITTYPFNINTHDFDKTKPLDDDYIDVNDTHIQWYQLNMNSADTVVWYCLDYRNNPAIGIKNDAMNMFYIYSKGNVTYSGAGHSSPTGSAEAQLFVNTMIAAYRVAQVSPEVKFTDSSGKKEAKYFLVPADDSGVLTFSSSSADTSRFIYFKVDDASIGVNKTISVKFSDVANSNQKTIPVYNSETNIALGTGESLISGLTYYIKIDDLWATFPNIESKVSNGVTIYITASTKMGSNPDVSSKLPSSIYLKSLALFNLS